MACMGPERLTEEETCKITEKVLEFLAKEYKIWGPNPETILKLKKDWNDQIDVLHKAIDELCWIDSCISF
jgi:hypothetical protein